MTADPRAAGCFHFLSCAYAPEAGEARLIYRFDAGPELVERIGFPGAPWPPDEPTRAAFGQALRLLHWIAGVSYWKAALAPEIRFHGTAPGPALRDFLVTLYREGLAEFAYVNGVRIADRLHLPAGTGPEQPAVPLQLPKRALVAMGGGKDSLVGLELCRETGVPVQPWCVGAAPLIEETVTAAGLELLRVRRQLAPGLRALNAAGAWNGHLPVTAIHSAIGVCAALLYGFRQVVFSNERSADEPSRQGADGAPINHQYSKSAEFEAAFRVVVRERVSPGLEYFSILRPYSELAVVGRFARMERYHAVYSSCNRNFHLDGPALAGRWCGRCPKCRFAALSLAVFLEPERVRAILGAELLDDPGQEAGFRALCGLGADRPFECVGTAGECRAALRALAADPGWRDRVIIRRLAPELAGLAVPALNDLLRPWPGPGLPAHLPVTRA